MTDAKAKELLHATIGEFVVRGFTISAQTETTVQMVKPRRFDFLPALLWFLVFGVGVLIYVFYYMSKRDETVYIRIHGDEVVIDGQAPAGQEPLARQGLDALNRWVFYGIVSILVVIIVVGLSRNV